MALSPTCICTQIPNSSECKQREAASPPTICFYRVLRNPNATAPNSVAPRRVSCGTPLARPPTANTRSSQQCSGELTRRTPLEFATTLAVSARNLTGDCLIDPRGGARCRSFSRSKGVNSLRSPSSHSTCACESRQKESEGTLGALAATRVPASQLTKRRGAFSPPLPPKSRRPAAPSSEVVEPRGRAFDVGTCALLQRHS